MVEMCRSLHHVTSSSDCGAEVRKREKQTSSQSHGYGLHNMKSHAIETLARSIDNLFCLLLLLIRRRIRQKNLFNFYVQHFARPMTKDKMVAITILIEKGCSTKKEDKEPGSLL